VGADSKRSTEMRILNSITDCLPQSIRIYSIVETPSTLPHRSDNDLLHIGCRPRQLRSIVTSVFADICQFRQFDSHLSHFFRFAPSRRHSAPDALRSSIPRSHSVRQRRTGEIETDLRGETELDKAEKTRKGSKCEEGTNREAVLIKGKGKGKG